MFDLFNNAHPTLKNNLTVLKAIHHCALLDGVLHIELILPFARRSGFEALKQHVGGELLRVTGGQPPLTGSSSIISPR